MYKYFLNHLFHRVSTLSSPVSANSVGPSEVNAPPEEKDTLVKDAQASPDAPQTSEQVTQYVYTF